MLNERIEVANQFASGIKAIEDGINQTMADVGSLFAAIPAARAKLGKSVPLETGIEVTESLAALAAGLAANYRTAVEAHRHLAADRDLLGLRAVGWGDLQACPKTGSATSIPMLRSVEAA